MKNVKKIFYDDCKHLLKHFFAVVIIIGVCFLPALYAWFNIYSNWDPYGSTGELKLAAISTDKGYTFNGEYTNVGETMMEQLHENTAVNWQFVATEDEAISGVNDGTYYAAVVIGEDFTRSMYTVFTSELSEPTLKFYVNQKKNPVATKISDTVVSTLQNSINEAFIDVVFTKVFAGAGDAYNNLDEEGKVDLLLDKLNRISADLEQYKYTFDNIVFANNQLVRALEKGEAELNQTSEDIKNAGAGLDNASDAVKTADLTVQDFENNMSALLTNIINNMESMKKNLRNSELETDVNKVNFYIAEATNDAHKIAADLNALGIAYTYAQVAGKAENTEVTDPNTSQKTTAALLILSMAQTAASWSGEIDLIDAKGAGAVGGTAVSAGQVQVIKVADTIIEDCESVQLLLERQVKPMITSLFQSLEGVLASSSELMYSIADMVDSVSGVYADVEDTVNEFSDGLVKTGAAMEKVSDRLIATVDAVNSAASDERVEVLINTLTGDPSSYGQFFSEPVEVVTKAVYPIANYGSAVAPFYTTLAIWVGALVLTSIIRVTPTMKNYPGVTDSEAYVGRYVLYFILAQLQATIIWWGDLNILHIQCLEPGAFWFACSLTATTFSLFIYSLTVTWGDVGKAVSVVILVLQIAGSSGTYPIELLPEFFRKIYVIFPFPYAINAMRECICGMYENDYTIYLLQLSIFIVVSLFIGMVIRVPFKSLNHFFEERMEDTDMM